MMRVSTLNMHNHAVADLLTSQQTVAKLMNQVSTGKKISAPSDDPVLYDRTQVLSDSLLDLQNWKSNIGIAENHISLVEGTLKNFENILTRVDTLQKQAVNGTLADSDRQIIAQELSGKLTELVELANSKDSNGNYLFAGFSSFVKPYVMEEGNFVFQGDSGERQLQVGMNMRVPISFSGFSLFETVKEGNGTFVCDEDPLNKGTGLISQGIIINKQDYIADNYTIHFVKNPQNQVCYYVDSVAQGQIVPPLPAQLPQDAIIFDPQDTIRFNGIELSMSEFPADGDVFYVSPSKPQNIFNSINELIAIINKPINTSQDKTLFLNSMDRITADIDQGYQQVLLNLTTVGAIMNTLDNELNINEDLINYSQETLSLLEDIDMVEAISKYTQQMTALQAAQMTYVKIQGLSLFNYI